MESMTIAGECVRRAATIDVLIVGGRQVVRERLQKLLDDEPGYTVAGSVSHTSQALRAIAHLRPDVVIVSLSGAPLARTMRALRTLTAGGSCPRTILLANAIEKTNVVHAQALGVSGIVSRDVPPQVLFDSVRCVAAGYCWLGHEPVDRLADGNRQLHPGYNRFGLTKRELEVVQAVVRSLLLTVN
jgi:DNA-binding NarL/FixJ family response regulator